MQYTVSSEKYMSCHMLYVYFNLPSGLLSYMIQFKGGVWSHGFGGR